MQHNTGTNARTAASAGPTATGGTTVQTTANRCLFVVVVTVVYSRNSIGYISKNLKTFYVSSCSKFKSQNSRIATKVFHLSPANHTNQMLSTALDHCKQQYCVSIMVYFVETWVRQCVIWRGSARQSTALQVKQSPTLPAFLLPSDSAQEADEASGWKQQRRRRSPPSQIWTSA